MAIKNNIKAFQTELKDTKCRLIAVSKTQPIEKVYEAYEAGQRLFGENKAQEMASKYEALPKDIEWHMIGHLQTNKVKYIAPFVSLIHSVDSIKLLEEINKQAKKSNRKIRCLLQVYIAHEETKFGLDPEEVIELANQNLSNAYPNLEITGLMGMATFTDNQEQIRNEFRRIRTLFDQLKSRTLPATMQMTELSIGMSADYKIALEEGSTLVRVGTAIFGERNYATNS
jgi:pyridoxal phosphate enzyme (YggS family)